jgi:hypothetical protein
MRRPASAQSRNLLTEGSCFAAASAASCARCSMNTGSTMTVSASTRSPLINSNALATSSGLRASRIRSWIPNDRAVASVPPTIWVWKTGLVGFQRTPTSRSFGATFIKSSSDLPPRYYGHTGSPGHVASRSREVCNETGPNGIANGKHHDRNRVGCVLCRWGSLGTHRNHEIDSKPDQLSRQVGQAVISPIGRSMRDENTVTFHVTERAKAVTGGVHMGLKRPIRCTFVVCCVRAARGSPVAAPPRRLMKSRHRLRYLVGGEQSAQVTSYQFSSHVVPRTMHHRRLLRRCRMRPSNRGRAAEQDDELPPSHRLPVPRCGDASSISVPNPCRMQNSGNSASQSAHSPGRYGSWAVGRPNETFREHWVRSCSERERESSATLKRRPCRTYIPSLSADHGAIVGLLLVERTRRPRMLGGTVSCQETCARLSNPPQRV